MQMPVKNPLYRIPGKDLGDLGHFSAGKDRRIVEKNYRRTTQSLRRLYRGN